MFPEDAYEKIAKEFGLDKRIIESVVRSQFRFVKSIIEQGRLKNVLLRGLGRFVVKPGRLKYLNNKYQKMFGKDFTEVTQAEKEAYYRRYQEEKKKEFEKKHGQQ